MKARIYKTRDGYTLINSGGGLYNLTRSKGGFIEGYKGKVGAAYVGTGQLLKKIPDELKQLFYKLNTK
jgi:hypothetical protein